MDTYISKVIKNGKLRISDGLRHDSSDERGYEIRMITGNDIPVFLSCRKCYADEKEEYVYDVTSMISLPELSKIKSLTFIELKILIESVILCQIAIDNYLLSPEGLILDPEYVFFDRIKKKFKYCFFPWDKDDVYSSYTKLAEFLLSAVDYSDEKAVDAAYDIYASILNKDYDLSKYIDIQEDEEYEEETTRDICTDTLKDEAGICKDNEKKHRLSPLSIVCLTIFFIFVLVLLMLFIFFNKLFIHYALNAKILSITVLSMCMLLYFPIMNL